VLNKDIRIIKTFSTSESNTLWTLHISLNFLPCWLSVCRKRRYLALIVYSFYGIKHKICVIAGPNGKSGGSIPTSGDDSIYLGLYFMWYSQGCSAKKRSAGPKNSHFQQTLN